MSRRIIYRPEFDDDARHLGGIAAVQKVIDPLIESLANNPFAFGLLDVNEKIRYAGTRQIGSMPALIIAFSIDNDGDVIMLSVKQRQPHI